MLNAPAGEVAALPTNRNEQLDLFEPFESGYQFEAVLTNKCLSEAKPVTLHSGRGSQGGFFAALR